jgi:predicted AlkP superfamily pyrophosphatase or phosphodiesterase
VSDHGFKLVERQIRLNVALAQAGLITIQDGKITASQAYAVPEGGSAIVFLTAPDPTGDLLARVKKAIAGVEGVDAAVEPADYGRFALPQPAATDQMGALFVTPRDGYAFAAPAEGNVVVEAADGSLGAHGYPATDPDLGALFIASGAGIRSGVRLDVIDSVDVAPTIAEVLGLSLGKVDGQVLSQILSSGR